MLQSLCRTGRQALAAVWNGPDNLIMDLMDRYRLRAAEPADEQALRDLFATVFGKHLTADEWRWKYQGSCRLAQAAGYPCAESMVACEPDGRIVAHAGVLTLPGWFQGKAIPIIQVCDVMVHPKHRGGLGKNNLFTVLLRALLAQVAARLPHAFGYGFPGERPYLLGERARVYARLERALEFSIPSKRALGLWYAAPLAWDDPRIDALWERLKGQCRLGLIRDRAYLRWRYAKNPARRYRLYGLYHLGRLRGWGVGAEEQDELRLVDLWCPQALVRSGLSALARRIALDLGQEGQTVKAWLPLGYREAWGEGERLTPVVAAQMRWEGAISPALARDLLYYTMGDVDIF